MDKIYIVFTTVIGFLGVVISFLFKNIKKKNTIIDEKIEVIKSKDSTIKKQEDITSVIIDNIEETKEVNIEYQEVKKSVPKTETPLDHDVYISANEFYNKLLNKRASRKNKN